MAGKSFFTASLYVLFVCGLCAPVQRAGDLYSSCGRGGEGVRGKLSVIESVCLFCEHASVRALLCLDFVGENQSNFAKILSEDLSDHYLLKH